MNTFWGLTGYLPVLLYGLALYWLLVKLPRRFRSKRSETSPDSRNQSARPPTPEPEPTQRRRSLVAAPPAERSEQASGPTAGVTPPPAAGKGPAGAPVSVSESVSVILRRQIPPRFDETSRSWLGGLPCMPEAIQWPRSVSSEHPEKGERPLHFLAQICCADLPAELWGGLGPREGWLSLFIDPNQGCPEGADAFRIVHIPELGPERQPPFDLGPVHDGVYTGPDYRYLMAGENVPNVWRRWPVDLVPVSNRAREVEGRVLAAPEGLASILYEGAEIADDRVRPGPVRPFTYGQALHAVGALQRLVDHDKPPVQLPERFIEHIRQDGAIEKIIVRCGEEAVTREPMLAEVRANLATASADERTGLAGREAGLAQRIDHYRRLAAWLEESGGADGVIRYFENIPALRKAWADRLRPQVEAGMERLNQHSPDTPFSDTDWQDLVDSFAGQDFTYWFDDSIHSRDGKVPIPFREITISTAISPPVGMHEMITDMYVDRERRSRIPDEIVCRYEPWWRRLYGNRPHRMGGYHDGVQSDAVIGPAKELLLFQIASDEAMHWCWGDVGAYYFWIRPKHLAAGDYSGVQMWLECH